MKLRICFILIVILIIGQVWIAPSFSQETDRLSGNSSILGFVRSAYDSTLIPNANIVLSGTGLGTITNDFGYFRIANLPSGKYTLEIKVIGFGKYTAGVTLGEAEHFQIDAYLEIEPILIEEIERRARSPEVEVKEIPISRQVFTELEVQTAASAIGQADVFRAVQMLPGVISISDFSSELYVRGGTPSQNLIILDGAVIYNPYHFGGFFSTFNSSAISKAELIIGGFPAPYGGRISSVLNLTTNPGNPERWTGRIDANPITANMSVGGPIPKGSMSLAARRSFKGDLSLFYNKDKTDPYVFTDMPFTFQDFQGKVRLNPIKNHIIEIAGYYNTDHLSELQLDSMVNLYNTNQRSTDYTYFGGGYSALGGLWGNRSLSINWFYNHNDLITAHFTYAMSRFHMDMDFVDTSMDPNQIYIKNTLNNVSIKGEIVLNPTGYLQLRAGIERHEEVFDYDLKGGIEKWGVGLESVIEKDLIRGVREPLTLSPYGDITFEYLNILRFQAGLRIDRFQLPVPSRQDMYTDTFPQYTHEIRHFDSVNRTTVDPRFGIHYQFHPKMSLNGAYGIYHQNLHSLPIQDEMSIKFLDIWFPLDKKYDPIQARHLIGGFEYQLEDSIELSVEIYHKKISNLLERSDVFYPWIENSLYTVGSGSIRGIEFLLRRSGRSTYGWIGYSLSQARGSFNSLSYDLSHDRRHAFNVVLHWFSWDKGWETTFSWMFLSGLPTSQLMGRYRVVDVISPQETHWTNNPSLRSFSWKVIEGPKNAANYPPYHRMDISVRRRLRVGSVQCIPYMQIMNVYHQTNIIYLKRKSRFQAEIQARKAWVDRWLNYPEFKILPMLPVIITMGCQVEF